MRFQTEQNDSVVPHVDCDPGRDSTVTSSPEETVLVTGCSSGIGRELARAFLEDGWVVYATGRDERVLHELADRGVKTATVDVTSDADVITVVDQLVADEGRIDCLVNNAGYGQAGPVEDVPTKHVVRQFDVNVFGPHRFVRAVLPHMRSRDSGRIVNVASVVDRIVLPGMGIYSASKFALRAMSDALRQELHGTGIDVVVVEPWIVATDFFDRAVDELCHAERSPPYDDLYRLLESLTAIDDATLSVAAPQITAHAILRVASAENPHPYIRVGRWAKVGAVVGHLLTGRRRDRATNSGLDLLSWLLSESRSADGDSQ